MDPVRIKVYGLASRTRRRYLIEAAMGTVFGLALLVAWWLGWPRLRPRLTALEGPPALRGVVAVLDWAPWILLGAAVCKGMEVLVVLRLFAHKEAIDRQKEIIPPPEPG